MKDNAYGVSIENPFTKEAIAHYNAYNGTQFDGTVVGYSASAIHLCPMCEAIALWISKSVCKTCGRSL